MHRGGMVERRTPAAPKPVVVIPPAGKNAAAGSAGSAAVGTPSSQKKRDSTLAEIRRMERAREDRRRNIEQARANRAKEEARNIANGNPGDVDFQRMIRDFRTERASGEQPWTPAGDLKICIAVRKRPVNSKEIRRKDHDSVSCFHPEVTVHDCKLRVDGITKYLDSTAFRFDYAFGEDATGDDVYFFTAKPLVPFVVNRGRATVFAYGQTGSGKTYTMLGIQQHAVDDLFALLDEAGDGGGGGEGPLQVYVSFFEIYGGRCQDLLNNRHRLAVREDGKGDVHIAGLEESAAADAAELAALIGRGNANRTTHATESNDESSRSHAICQISLREARSGRLHGRLSLIDLAGSERGADTNSHNRQRRMEGAEINKSLLALKECIRALDSDSVHIPYRASKLTLVLKDSFTRKAARTVMIATVSPAASSADHTLNTLRYADRVKEHRVAGAPDPSPDAVAAAAAGGSAGGGGLGGGLGLAGEGGDDAAAAAAAPREPRRVREGWDEKSWESRDDDLGGGGGGNSAAAAGARRGSRSKTAAEARGTLATARAAVAAAPSDGRRAAHGKGRHRGSDDDASAPSSAAQGRRASAGGGAAELKARPSAPQKDGRRPRGGGNDDDSDADESSGGGGGGGGELRNGGGGGGGHRSAAAAAEGAAAALQRSQASDDIEYLHETIRKYNTADSEEVVELHRTVQGLFEEEEALLNLHMTVIQENAELLTEEGRLLQQIQGDDVVDYDIDAYAARLSEILDKKAELTGRLQRRLRTFRRHLEAEEKVSSRVHAMPQW